MPGSVDLSARSSTENLENFSDNHPTGIRRNSSLFSLLSISSSSSFPLSIRSRSSASESENLTGSRQDQTDRQVKNILKYIKEYDSDIIVRYRHNEYKKKPRSIYSKEKFPKSEISIKDNYMKIEMGMGNKRTGKEIFESLERFAESKSSVGDLALELKQQMAKEEKECRLLLETRPLLRYPTEYR